MEDYFKKLMELGLNKRIFYSLWNNGIDNIEKLMTITFSELQRTPGIGRESINKVQIAINKLKSNGISESNSSPSIISKLMSIDNKITGMNSILVKLVDNKINNMSLEIQDMRTIILEQYRLLQCIHLEKSPDGVIKKIESKIPGFSSIIYDLYQKLEQI